MGAAQMGVPQSLCIPGEQPLMDTDVYKEICCFVFHIRTFAADILCHFVSLFVVLSLFPR